MQNDCDECMDSGFVFVKVKSTEPTVFMFCNCKKGTENEIVYSGSLPIWNKHFAAVGFNKEEFDLKLFLPETNSESPITMESLLNSNTFLRFRSMLDKSREYFGTLSARQESGQITL